MPVYHTDEFVAKQDVDSVFRIYGDNILETELIIDWIDHTGNGLEITEKRGPTDRPIYICEDEERSGENYAIQLCPGYDRWKSSPLDGLFAEKPDILINKVTTEEEGYPILAIESCDAVQAGNQAWQRFRRATDAAEANIPYLYVTPLIDWEHETRGKRLKGPRYQSAQITIGQLALCSRLGVPSLQVYEVTSWSEYAEERDYPLPNDYPRFNGLNAGSDYLVSLIRNEASNNRDFTDDRRDAIDRILEDMFNVLERYSKYKNTEYPIHVDHPSLIDSRDVVSDGAV